MKTFLLVGLLAQAQAPAAPPQPPRADAHFVIGWQNLQKTQPDITYNDWLNAILYGGAGAGWYWTDNVKTQVDVGAGTRASQYRTRQFPSGAGFAYESSRLQVQQWAVTVEQQYQFFHNAWFHPHVGAGVELARETSTEFFQPVIVYDSPVARQIRPARTEGPRHDFLARGVGDVGFKAYMTRQAFFTTDMRVMFRNGIDQVLFRAGFGFDF